MKFRKATSEDAKELITLTHTAFLRYAMEVGRSVSGTSETYDDIISDIENKYVMIAEDENGIAGAARIELIDNVAYISRLCSSESHKEVSAGSQILDRIKNTFDVDALCLHTGTKIVKLVLFYYRCGFYIHSISHDRGYPRGLFVCPIKEGINMDYDTIINGR